MMIVDPQFIVLATATYDRETRGLIGQCTARLTPTEHAILTCLEKRRGKMVSMDAIIGAIWDPDDEPEDALNNVTTHLSRIRKKMRTVGIVTLVIRNVWGAGYALTESDRSVKWV
jgi:DNA-binding response OmpR family regulator